MPSGVKKLTQFTGADRLTAWPADDFITFVTTDPDGAATSKVLEKAAFDDRFLVQSNNLSDLDDAATARTNLGVAIGSDVQAWDAQLDDIAALAVTDGNFIVGDGANWVAESGATARTSLGLGTIATINDAASDGFAYGRLNAAWAKVGGLALANTWTAAQTIKVDTATTNAVLNVQTIGANVTDAGVGAAGFGPGLLFTGESTTTVDRNMAQIAAVWSTATDASRTSYLSFSTVNSAAALAETVRIAPALVTVNTAQYINTNSATALLVEQNGVKDNVLVVDTTNGRVGINKSAPSQALELDGNIYINNATGKLYVGSGATFFGVSAGNFSFTTTTGNLSFSVNTASPISFATNSVQRFLIAADGTSTLTKETAITNDVSTVLEIAHNSTGTPAANFGPQTRWQGESSTTVAQTMGEILFRWVDATHASRKAKGQLTAHDTAQRICIGWGASGTAPMCGFFNIATTPVVQPAAVADATGAGDVVAQLNELLARIRSLGLIAT